MKLTAKYEFVITRKSIYSSRLICQHIAAIGIRHLWLSKVSKKKEIDPLRFYTMNTFFITTDNSLSTNLID